MNVKIKPKKLYGRINAISSKSYAHRIVISAALCREETEVEMNYISDDIRATFAAIESLGAVVENTGVGIKIIPIGQDNVRILEFKNKSKNLFVNCKECGTTARFILPLMTTFSSNGNLIGEGSLNSRPFEQLCNSMERNGVKFDQYKLPIKYTGCIQPGEYEIDGGESSQYFSSLMIALPLLNDDSLIKSTSPIGSKGYIDITIDVLSKFGIRIEEKNKQQSYIYDVVGNQEYVSPKKIKVEGDWTNASYWNSIGVDVEGLDEDSLQQDKMFSKVRDLKEIDATNIPDIVPTLAVYATQKEYNTKICNVGRLRHKESDRINSIFHMIKSLGGDIEILKEHTGISILIKPKPLIGGIVNSYNDHRIVMATSIASTFCKDDVVILSAEAVNKSYGTFFEDFESLGGEIEFFE